MQGLLEGRIFRFSNSWKVIVTLVYRFAVAKRRVIILPRSKRRVTLGHNRHVCVQREGKFAATRVIAGPYIWGFSLRWEHVYSLAC